MRKILISYGDGRFKKSLRRLRKEGKKLNIFDEILMYTYEDLPIYIKSSPLFAFERLGGYAVWKSYIIYESLKKCKKGDILVYVDAGCSLQQSQEWNVFFNLLKEGSTIIFKYRNDIDYGWKPAFGSNATTQNSAWIKKSVQEYFWPIFDDDKWLLGEKIWSGALILCKGNNQNKLIEQWFKLTILNPELSMDVYGNELRNQDVNFVEHRHDQALLGILAYYFKDKQEIFFLDETAESKKDNAAIIASRLKDEIKEPLNVKTKRFVKSLIGEKSIDKLKTIITKK